MPRCLWIIVIGGNHEGKYNHSHGGSKDPTNAVAFGRFSIPGTLDVCGLRWSVPPAHANTYGHSRADPRLAQPQYIPRRNAVHNSGRSDDV